MLCRFHLCKTKINIPNIVIETQFLDYSVLRSAITSLMDVRDIISSMDLESYALHFDFRNNSLQGISFDYNLFKHSEHTFFFH